MITCTLPVPAIINQEFTSRTFATTRSRNFILAWSCAHYAKCNKNIHSSCSTPPPPCQSVRQSVLHTYDLSCSCTYTHIFLSSYSLLRPVLSVLLYKRPNVSNSAALQNVSNTSLIIFSLLPFISLSLSLHSETTSLLKCHYHDWFFRPCQRRSGGASLYEYSRCCLTLASMNSRL